jgi:hypothetical protein
VITPGQAGGPTVGNFQWIACKFSGKRVEFLWNRQARAAPLS